MATYQKSKEDLLQTLIDHAHSKGRIESDAGNSFTADNCKSICFFGHESTAVSATRGLMLLALKPEWQARARTEVLEVCGGQLPNADNMLQRLRVGTRNQVVELEEGEPTHEIE